MNPFAEKSAVTIENIKKYTLQDLATIATEEPHAVRDEIFRRHESVAKRLTKLQKESDEMRRILKSTGLA
jgi:hypothetical protein